MINLNDIQEMVDEWNLTFFLPDQLSKEILTKLREYNKFKFLGIKNKTYEVDHPYQDMDYMITDYYSCCLYDQKISYPDFFKLLKHMIICCPSITFAVIFSDYLSFFRVGKCNFYCNYFKLLSKNLTDEVAIWAVADYLINVFEDKREWSDGKFFFDLLTEDNQNFINRMSQYID